MSRKTTRVFRVWLTVAAIFAPPARAAVTLTGSPVAVDFAYQVNDAVLPVAKTLTINSAGSATTPAVSVQVTSAPPGWLTVAPDTGRHSARAVG